MAALFNRRVRVTVEGVQVEGLRASFKIKKTLSKEPNTCELELYNLSQTSRAAVQKKGARVMVEAGYESELALIYSGDARTVDTERSGPDWITRFQCGDGERAARFSTVAESFKAGTSVADVFKKLAGQSGLDVSQAVRDFGQFVKEQFTQGFSASGKTLAEIDRLVKGRGLEWSIQDNRLQLIQTGGASKELVVILGPDSGLIGSPQNGTPDSKNGKPVVKAKALLSPRLIPGGRVRFEAENFKGDYRANLVEHIGDTHGADWYTQLEAVPL